jgi:hypothetical protein
VKLQNVTFTVTASPTTVKLGQNVTIHWTMDPFVTNANVTVSYRINNETTFTKLYSVLMTSPSMSYTWKVDVTGTITIYVGWAGNASYSNAVSSVEIKSS